MPTDPRIDAYIAKSAPFAQPILEHLRALVHKGCPEATETLKWGMPHFEHRGVLCNMAAFKQHCAFGFWKSELVTGSTRHDAMGQLGRIGSLADLPADAELLGWVQKAAALNAESIRQPRPVKHPKPVLEVPADFAAALAVKAGAAAHFEGFAPSQRREYLEWFAEAKTETTRARRMEQALALIAEGKIRNWKYQKG